jgi:hypothetical protein
MLFAGFTVYILTCINLMKNTADVGNFLYGRGSLINVFIDMSRMTHVLEEQVPLGFRQVKRSIQSAYSVSFFCRSESGFVLDASFSATLSRADQPET